MRLLVILMTIVFLVGILGFFLMNPDARVLITLWNVEYPQVRISSVVLVSLAVGILYVGVIAIAEGASIRLQNRRLRKELQRLETELNYLRTQPAAPVPREPESPVPAVRGEPAATPRSTGFPTAPVYEAEGADPDSDPGDDAYSGGRGV